MIFHASGYPGARRSPPARELAGRRLYRIPGVSETSYDLRAEIVVIVVPPVLLDVVDVGAAVAQPSSAVAHSDRAETVVFAAVRSDVNLP